MSGQLMDTLSPYRDRVRECAVNVAGTFEKDTAMQFFMAGVRYGADLMMCAALCDGQPGFTYDGAASDYLLYTAYTSDYMAIAGRREDEGHAEQDDTGAFADAS